MKKLILLTLLLYGALFDGMAQHSFGREGSHTQITACAGTFNHTFRNNGRAVEVDDTYTVTICPDDARQGVYSFLKITADLEDDFDDAFTDNVVSVYNGRYVNEANLIAKAQYAGAQSTRFSDIILRSTDASGCLTIQWKRFYNNNNAGLAFEMGCMRDCKSIEASLDAYNLSDGVKVSNPEDIIKVCKGEAMKFYGKGIYGSDVTKPKLEDGYDVYTQTDAESEFSWIVTGDDNIYKQPKGEDTFDYTFDEPGEYNLLLYIEDHNKGDISGRQELLKCQNYNWINKKIIVVGDNNSNIGETIEICERDTPITFTQSTNFSPVGYVCTGDLAEEEETFIPDGIGIGYPKPTFVTCFEAGRMFNPGDIESVTIELEHSFVGDLIISLVSPSEEEIIILNSNTLNGHYFGEPYTYRLNGAITDQDNGTNGQRNPQIGNPFRYTWRQRQGINLDNEAFDRVDGPTAANPHTYAEGTVFRSANDFDGLSGRTELNGVWQVRVQDTYPNDNGYLVSYEIKFKDGIPRNETNYVPSIDSYKWTVDDPSTVLSEDQNQIQLKADQIYDQQVTFSYELGEGCTGNIAYRAVVRENSYAGGTDTQGDAVNLGILRHADLNQMNLYDTLKSLSIKDPDFIFSNASITVTADWESETPASLAPYLLRGDLGDSKDESVTFTDIVGDNYLPNGKYRLKYTTSRDFNGAICDDFAYLDFEVTSEVEIEHIEDVIVLGACKTDTLIYAKAIFNSLANKNKNIKDFWFENVSKKGRITTEYTQYTSTDNAYLKTIDSISTRLEAGSRYKAIAIDQYGAKDSVTFRITKAIPFTVSAGADIQVSTTPNTTAFDASTTKIADDKINPTLAKWTYFDEATGVETPIPAGEIDDATKLRATATPGKTMTYLLRITDIYGCEQVDTVKLVYAEFEIDVTVTPSCEIDKTITVNFIKGSGANVAYIVTDLRTNTEHSRPLTNPFNLPVGEYRLDATDVDTGAKSSTTFDVLPQSITADINVTPNNPIDPEIATISLDGIGTNIGSTATLTYKWESIFNGTTTDAGSTEDLVLNTPLSASGTKYRLIVRSSEAGCETIAEKIIKFDIKVIDETHKVRACDDTFIINPTIIHNEASEAEITYTWFYKGGAKIADGKDITLQEIDLPKFGETKEYTLKATSKVTGIVGEGTYTITREEAPVATITKPTIFDPEIINITLDGIGTGVPVLVYSWKEVGDLTELTNTEDLTIDPLGNNVAPFSGTVYEFTVTDGLGCGSTVTQEVIFDIKADNKAQTISSCETDLKLTGSFVHREKDAATITYQWLDGTTEIVGQTANTIDLTTVELPLAGFSKTFTLKAKTAFNETGIQEFEITRKAVSTVYAGDDIVIGKDVDNTILKKQFPNYKAFTPAAGSVIWTHKDGTPLAPGELSDPTIINPIANPATTTTYIVTVTDDKGLCPISDEVTLTREVIDITIAGDLEHGSCEAGNEITFNVTTNLVALDLKSIEVVDRNDGTKTWSIGINNPKESLPAGDYTVTATSKTGATTTFDFTVTQTAVPTVNAGTDITLGEGVINTTPFTTVFTPAGSTIEWTKVGGVNGSAAADLDDDTIAEPIANPVATTDYTMTVTDQYGCTAEDDVSLIRVSVDITVEDQTISSCETDAPVVIITVGDISNITIVRTDVTPEVEVYNDATVPTTLRAVPGEYKATVISAAGANDEHIFTISQLVAPTVSITSIATLTPTTTTLTIVGNGTGEGILTYAWEDLANLGTVISTNKDLLFDDNDATKLDMPVTGTTYQLTVTDAYNCATSPETITINYGIIAIEEDHLISSCETNLVLTAEAIHKELDKATIIYTWYEKGTVAPLGTGETFDLLGLPNSGNTKTYILRATTISGETDDEEFTITRAIAPKAIVKDAAAFTNLPATTKSIVLDGSGSIGDDLLYQWSVGGVDIPAPEGTKAVIQRTQADNTLTNGQVYTLIITDKYGCSDPANITVSFGVTLTVDNAIIPFCEDKATITAKVDRTDLDNLTFVWRNKADGSIVLQGKGSDANDDTFQHYEDAVVGTYTVTVTDELSGVTTAPKNITVTKAKEPKVIAWSDKGKLILTPDTENTISLGYRVSDKYDVANYDATTITWKALRPHPTDLEDTWPELIGADADDAFRDFDRTSWNPVPNPTKTTAYVITVVDVLGCPASATVIVYVRPKVLVNDLTVGWCDTDEVMSITVPNKSNSEVEEIWWTNGVINENHVESTGVAGGYKLPVYVNDPTIDDFRNNGTYTVRVKDNFDIESIPTTFNFKKIDKVEIIGLEMDSLNVDLFSTNAVVPKDVLFDEVKLEGMSEGIGYTYDWAILALNKEASLDNPTILNPTATISGGSDFELIVTDDFNCKVKGNLSLRFKYDFGAKDLIYGDCEKGVALNSFYQGPDHELEIIEKDSGKPIIDLNEHVKKGVYIVNIFRKTAYNKDLNGNVITRNPVYESEINVTQAKKLNIVLDIASKDTIKLGLYEKYRNQFTYQLILGDDDYTQTSEDKLVRSLEDFYHRRTDIPNTPFDDTVTYEFKYTMLDRYNCVATDIVYMNRFNLAPKAYLDTLEVYTDSYGKLMTGSVNLVVNDNDPDDNIDVTQTRFLLINPVRRDTTYVTSIKLTYGTLEIDPLLGVANYIPDPSVTIEFAEVIKELNEKDAQYRIVDAYGEVSYAKIQIVLKEGTIEAYNIFTPDDVNGANDYFVIKNVTLYPENNVKIYNRWGNLIYEGNNYQNDWDGTANRGLGKGTKLPQGTYFWLLDLGNGAKYNGYVVIQR